MKTIKLKEYTPIHISIWLIFWPLSFFSDFLVPKATIKTLEDIYNYNEYIVNTSDDYDDGICDEFHCSLREAINASNSDNVPSKIRFYQYTIALESSLPKITEDGTIIGDPNFQDLEKVKISPENEESSQINYGIEIEANDFGLFGVDLRGFGTAIFSEAPIERITIGNQNNGNKISECTLGIVLTGNRLENIILQQNEINPDFNNISVVEGIILENAYSVLIAENNIRECEKAIILRNTNKVRLTKNRFINNFYEVIENNNLPENITPEPIIEVASTGGIMGVSMPGDTIEVYTFFRKESSSLCQGLTYLGSTITDSFGQWKIIPSHDQITEFEEVTATGTDTSGNTSGFSNCMVVTENGNCYGAMEIPLNEGCGRNTVRKDFYNNFKYTSTIPNSHCNISYNGNDLWFKVTVPQTGNLFVRQDGRTTINPIVEVFEGSCNELNSIYCERIADYPYLFILKNKVPGSELFVRVWDENNSILDSTSNAIIEFSAHVLTSDSSNWDLCLGSGPKDAFSFILELEEGTSNLEKQALIDTLTSLGAELIKECNCNKKSLQLWGGSSPIDIERKRSVARSRSSVDTTFFNRIFGESPCTNNINEIYDDTSPLIKAGNVYSSFEMLNIESDQDSSYYFFTGQSGDLFNLESFNACLIRYDSIWAGGIFSGKMSADGEILIEGFCELFTYNFQNEDGFALSELRGYFYIDEEKTFPLYYVTGFIYLYEDSQNNEVWFEIPDLNFFTYPVFSCVSLYNEVPDYIEVKPYNPITPRDTVKVGIIDTGVEPNNNILSNAYWEKNGEGNSDNCVGEDVTQYGYNFIDGGLPNDLDEHGTGVNGVIAQGFPGDIQLELMNLKFYENYSGTLFDAVCAIYYAIENEVDVINLSWGFRTNSFPEILFEALQEAEKQDILVVTSSGNDGINIDTIAKYPAVFDLSNIITVAGYEADPKGENIRLLPFSNFGGTTVDIAAPGIAVTTGLNNNKVLIAGTSISTPYVTRAIAILKGRFPNLTAAQIKNCIIASSDYWEKLDGKVISNGILDIEDAIACASRLIATNSIEDGIKQLQLKVFPNPTNRMVILSFFLPSSQRVQISLRDLNGRILKTIRASNENKGNHELRFDASDLRNGMYLLSFQTNLGIVSKRLIVLNH